MFVSDGVLIYIMKRYTYVKKTASDIVRSVKAKSVIFKTNAPTAE